MAYYTYVTLNDPLASYLTDATGINDGGQIVGYYASNKVGDSGDSFLYSGGTYTTLDDPLGGNSFTTGINTFAQGLNNAGQIVGNYKNLTGNHGFLYSGGTYTTLDDPLAVADTTAQGIDDAGQIVGNYRGQTASHGFLYSGGTYTTLDDPLGTTVAATGINNSGQIVGSYFDRTGNHGFFYSSGTYTTLNDPLGINGTWATGINNLSQIVGYYEDANMGVHGFLYSGGSYITLDDPLETSTSNSNGTFAFGINDAGQIVGQYYNNSGAHGFLAAVVPPTFDLSWNIVGTRDYNGGGFANLVWEQQSSNIVEIQLTTGNSTLGGGVIQNTPFDAAWSVVGTGDFNGDGKADLVYQRPSDGLVEIQLLNGNTAIGGGAVTNSPFDASWNVVAVGDFNGDGKADLVYQRQSDGLVEVQLLNGNTAIGGGVIANNPFGRDWKIITTGDFNGDGKSDLVWQNQATGLVELQFLDGNTAVGGGTIANNAFGPGWNVVGAGDFLGNGFDDLVYQRQSDGLVEIQFLNGNALVGGGPIANSPFGPGWQVVGVGDFNGDGKADLVYRNSTTGTTEVQLLSGRTPIGGGIVALG